MTPRGTSNPRSPRPPRASRCTRRGRRRRRSCTGGPGGSHRGRPGRSGGNGPLLRQGHHGLLGDPRHGRPQGHQPDLRGLTRSCGCRLAANHGEAVLQLRPRGRASSTSLTTRRVPWPHLPGPPLVSCRAHRGGPHRRTGADGGVSPWRLPLPAWREAALQWMAAPRREVQGAIMTSRLLVDDGLVILPARGDPRCSERPRRHPAPCGCCWRSCSSPARRRGRARRAGEEHCPPQGHALLPIVTAGLARLGCAVHHRAVKAAAGSAMLPDEQAHNLIGIGVQWCATLPAHPHPTGEPPTDLITRDRMSPIEPQRAGHPGRAAVHGAWTTSPRTCPPRRGRRGRRRDEPRGAVVGDVGGHRRELAASLVLLGVDPHTGGCRAGLGDLAHCGPDSEKVLSALSTVTLRHQPMQPGAARRSSRGAVPAKLTRPSRGGTASTPPPPHPAGCGG